MAGPAILIVEDEIIIARELEARLASIGYTVAGIASSGREAVRLAGELVPDLILMDIVLKGDMDGIEAAALIRRDWRIPVIYVTAYADRATLERARITEPFAYVVKPFSEGELHANIEMALYRHRAETRLRRLERWFVTAIEEIADAVIATDHASVITVFNAAAEAITAWRRDDAIGRKLGDVFRLVDRTSGEPVPLDRAYEGPLVCLGRETLLRDRLEDSVPVDATVSVVRDEQERSTGMVAVFRDATGRRHGPMTALVRDVAMTARAVTLEGMLQSCAEALVRRLNAAFARIWTLDADGHTLVLQASAGMYTHTDGAHGRVPVGRLKIGMIAETREPHLTNDVRNDPRIGDPEWARREGMVAFAGYPLMADDRIFGVMAMFARQELSADVLESLGAVADAVAVAIERKQAEETLRARLRRTSERLEQVTSTSPAILYTLEPGHNGLVPTWVSGNVTPILGYTPGEVLDPQWWPGRLHPDDRDGVLAQAETMLRSGVLAAEHRFLRKDGSVAWIRNHARVSRDEAGQVREVVGAWLDVTEHHQVEEQLLQSQKMETVGRLAGGVAHDFNNLLMVITGTSDLVLEGLGAADPRRADLQEIRGAAESAARLTRQLLAFSRKQIFQPQVLNLNAVLLDMETMLRRLIGEDVQLTIRPSSDLGNVRADPSQMEQVILNLVVNSRDAMPRGGRLTVETANVVLDEAYADRHLDVVPGPYAMLAVSDSGVGMDEATRLRVFEPFFTTKGLGRGTGLGLSTVYGIVRQSNGTVWVYSEPGRGTTFRVYLPLVREAVTAVEASAQPAPATGTETILVVEDETGVRNLIRRALEASGYTVLAPENVAATPDIAAAWDAPIDLLLTDMVMPGISGPTLALRLAADRPGLRILYMSGHAEHVILEQAELTPGTPLLTKPFDIATLKRTVRLVLDRDG